MNTILMQIDIFWNEKMYTNVIKSEDMNTIVCERCHCCTHCLTLHAIFVQWKIEDMNTILIQINAKISIFEVKKRKYENNSPSSCRSNCCKTCIFEPKSEDMNMILIQSEFQIVVKICILNQKEKI